MSKNDLGLAGRHSQNRRPWFHQGTMLHADESVLKQVSFRLRFRLDLSTIQHVKHALRALRLSLRSSPSCTSIATSFTVCLPSFCPTNPRLSFSFSNKCFSTRARSLEVAVCSSDFRSAFAVVTDASKRRLASLSASDRF